MAGMGSRALGVAAFLMALAIGAPGAAVAQTYPPVDTPGPALSVQQSQLDASLTCSGDLTAAAHQPVLLVPGTSLNPQKNYDWNWIPAVDALNWEWCTVELPGSSMGDIQIAGEYIVNAIRAMYADYGQRIDVLGHSQGGMVPRWALRFWPDIRAMVDDQIGIAASNHGTTAPPANAGCAFQGCAPAIHQQLATSQFIQALNSHQETFAGIDYTAIYTTTDDVITPNADDSGSSSLRPGDGPAITNISVQEPCPGNPYQSHALVGTVSNVAYLLAVEAMDNPGPADPSAINFAAPGACSNPMPGVDPMTGNADYADAQAYSSMTMNTYPKAVSEPLLACYAVTPCGPANPGGGLPAGGGGGGTTATGKRAAALKKCKKKPRRVRAKCIKKAKKLPA